MFGFGGRLPYPTGSACARVMKLRHTLWSPRSIPSTVTRSDELPGKNERLVMRLVTRESSKNEPRNERARVSRNEPGCEPRFYECAAGRNASKGERMQSTDFAAKHAEFEPLAQRYADDGVVRYAHGKDGRAA